MSEKQRFETRCLHAGQVPDPATGARAVPVHRTTSYVFEDSDHAARLFSYQQPGNIYTRMMNPTQDVLEKRMAAMEGGSAALALASGTSAIFYSVINLCSAGQEIVSASNLYGGTYTMFDNILPQFGIRTRFVDPRNPRNFDSAVNEKTRAVFAETIGNPSLDVTDIEAVAKIAQKHHLPLIIDGTFTTPYLLRAIERGANIVVNSATKWIGGHGTGIGGIVVDGGNFDWTDPKFEMFNTPDPSNFNMRFSTDLGENNHVAFVMRMRMVALRNLGACISPDNAWIFLQGMETLPLRMQRHCENAMALARHLKNHPKVTWVRYPGLGDDPTHPTAARYLEKGFGSVVVFGIKGGRDAGRRFIDSLELFSHLANVGDAKSLALHPASTTHSQLTDEQQEAAGVSPDMIRLSVGIEHIDDIVADLEHALEG
ncbi:MAG: O-acetylhomoserine aminocarboxypropyltransferase/cysteine synthase [Desulfobacteraceae bacterium]|nr:O-acetylhomoserine aminocarboxypropyltransferase/cysteine synthase [Desulfobacteraceae bacterium]